MDYDPDNYHDDLINFPQHIERALAQMENFNFTFSPKSIITCGMGGSAIPGYLLRNYCFDKLSIPVDVANSYNLPAWANEDTLVFVTSYSGNTEEALSCLKQALERNLKIVLISSNGLIEKAAARYNLPFIKAPQNFQPRAATPFLFTYMLEVLRKSGLICPDYEEALRNLKKMKPEINTKARESAEKLAGKFIFIYVPSSLESVGRRMQAQDFNENAKTLAKFSVIPEANHNELTAWDKCPAFPLAVIFVNDPKASASIKERMEFTKKVVSRKAEILEIKARGKSLLSRLLTPIYEGDMISYHLSIIRKINPLPVDVVQELKKHLSEKTKFKEKIIKDLLKE